MGKPSEDEDILLGHLWNLAVQVVPPEFKESALPHLREHAEAARKAGYEQCREEAAKMIEGDHAEPEGIAFRVRALEWKPEGK